MKGNEFIDTNILVYAKLEVDVDMQKRDMAIATIQQIQDCPVISVQVFNEFSNVLIKHAVSNDVIQTGS